MYELQCFSLLIFLNQSNHFSPCSFYHNAVATVVKIFLLEAKFWDINFETFNLFNLILLFVVF